MAPEKSRYYLLDALRGLSIILMVAYHFGYNLVLYRIAPSGLLYNPVLNFLQPFFASVFIAISGASSTFSHNNLRRGVKILLAAFVVSIATWAFNSEAYVRFGILHFLGCAALLYEAARPLIDKTLRYGWLWLVPFFVTNALLDRTFSVRHLWALGFRDASFVSTDYFPLMPWIFMYLFGVWLGDIVSRGRMPGWFYRLRFPFFEGCGKHTLIIYLLHQPVLIGLTLFIQYVMQNAGL